MNLCHRLPFYLHGAWWCIVGGITYGCWTCREYAQAGYETELRRLQRRLG